MLNPATPTTSLEAILPECDFVLLMSVNPGFGGQKFIPAVLDKVAELRNRIDREGLSVRLEIDGGVAFDNLDEVAASGVDIVVAGSAIFGGGDPRGATQAMVRRLAALAERSAP